MTEVVATGGRLRDPTSPRSVVMWAGLVVPPLAWGAQLVLGDFLFELGCAPGVGGERLADGVRLGRARVLTAMGAAHSALYLALILFGLLPPLVFEPCARLP